MPHIRLIHWNAAEAQTVMKAIEDAGFAVEYKEGPPPEIMRSLRATPPDAVVIDLSRLPSHGREMATALRGNRQTRQIPILFLSGDPNKVALIRQTLPDAYYCDGKGLAPALRKCIRNAPVNPVVPTQMMDRYAARTTAQKLGIAVGARVGVMNAPRDYARVIGALPDGVEFLEDSAKDCSVTVWFLDEPEALISALPHMKRAAATSRVWVAWPKKSARKDSLLSETAIREAALGCGLVDYKICSISPTWSGLCLAVKK